ncbi:hypothetical protein [Halomarina oriensis]|uniref:Uncharacterized protein n=1 Tax=Halomarina oriensis TaxID=671145 RepID=A0A6B0GN50_9EURY|nr:hypothetical protein [Halomarina oriensis]MWG36204.1 hypothetical protein [Halomarina oriensis]
MSDDEVACSYCDSTALAYELNSDRGPVGRCIPCLAIERGQSGLRQPAESFLDPEPSVVYDTQEKWDEHREQTYTRTRDWYRILARIQQDDPLLKRNPEDIGTVHDSIRTFLTNIMGEEAHYPPSDVAGSPVAVGQTTFPEVTDGE